jgi:hypothetical protein
MNKKIQLSILSIFIAAALVGSVATFGDNMAFATKKSSNDAAQLLGQSSETGQFSSCGAENNTIASCNNVGLSINAQDGNNALGQE